MADPKSVTQWIAELKLGDEQAASLLWQRYFVQMVRAARRKLGFLQLGVADEEDIALSAFDSLCRGAANGQFSQLTDRDDLWALLLTMTARKSIDRIRHEHRQRRGGDKAVVRDTDLPDHGEVKSIDAFLAQVPTPETLAMMQEQYERLLRSLRDDTLRSISQWKFEGFTNNQIAEFLGVSVHTVGRKLRMIRLTWVNELEIGE